MAFDIGLLPFVNNKFNSSGKPLLRYLDFSVNKVPVVLSKIIPFENIIEEGENGFIVENEEEWFSKIEGLINDNELRKEVGKYAHRMAWENFSYNTKTMQRLKSVFI